MDELDIRILRALSSDPDIAPHSTHAKTSPKNLAKKLGMDDLTLSNHLKTPREKGLLPQLQVIPNPGLFGYKMKAVLVDLPQESSKGDAMQKFRLLKGAVAVTNFYGNSLGIILFYESEESLRKTVDRISRITNAERVTEVQMHFPPCETKDLTPTDWAIIRSIEKDAVKPHQIVAKELGYSTRTVRNWLEKLQKKRAIMVTGNTDIGAVDSISSILFYFYNKSEVKSQTDRAMLSHFDKNYLWGRLTDPKIGYVVLVFPNMRLVENALSWAKQQPGVGSARMEVVVDTIDLWDNASDLFKRPLIAPPSALETI